MENKKHPGVSLRVKAAVTDSLVIVVMIIITAFIFSSFENVSQTVRILAFVFIFILYDPVFTSSFGGTIGHMLMGIKVKRENNHNKNIILPFALLRFVVKASLGWLSLLTVHNNEQGKAIHDFVVKSVVIYDDTEE